MIPSWLLYFCHMISYETFTLDNGLTVVVHEDHNTPTAVVNILYDVGSRDELPERTGFAHLFEHLMFGGSANIANFDGPLQKVGGDNNAFTSPDVTNYYISLPSDNIETAFWLESDRMLNLSFDPAVLEKERKVVIEEFKQRYLNQPYGKAYLNLLPLAYTTHSYRWPTIGMDISHIEEATMDDVKDFYTKYYCPNNAIMVVAGKVTLNQVKELSEKWFGPIPSGNVPVRNIPQEPVQTERRVQKIEAEVPLKALYLSFHAVPKGHEDQFPTQLLGDILGRGKTARLYDELVNETPIFQSISGYPNNNSDTGLFTISGKIRNGVSFEEAEEGIWEVLNKIIAEGITDDDLQRVKNKTASTLYYSEMELLSRAMNLAFAGLQGDFSLINKSWDLVKSVTKEQIEAVAKNMFKPEKASVLLYGKDEE